MFGSGIFGNECAKGMLQVPGRKNPPGSPYPSRQSGITHLFPLEAHVAQLLDQSVQPVLRSTDNSTVRQEA